MNYFKQIALVFGGAWNGRKYSIKSATALRAFIRVAPDVVRRLDQEHADRADFRAIGRVIAPWGRRIGDLRFETEGAWKRGGTTVDSLAKELRLALQYPEGRGSVVSVLSELHARLIITGGAGFIGSNLVPLRARPHHRPTRRRRQADLRRKPARISRRPLDAPARPLRAGRHRRAAAMAQVFAEAQPRAVLNLAAETHVDRSIDGPGRSSTPTSSARSCCSRRRGATGGLTASGSAQRSGFCTSRPTRSTARSAPSGLFTEETAVRAELAVCGEQGGGRSSGARLPSHLSAAGADHQLLEQLRTVPVSREADSADDPQRARRHAAADLRRRRQRPRLAARRGSLRRHPAGAQERAAPARSTTSAAATSGPTSRSSIASATRSTRCGPRRSNPALARALRATVASRRSCPIARATTAATPSTRRRSGASSDGRRATRSRTACARPSSGTSSTATGARRSRPAATTASGSDLGQ